LLILFCLPSLSLAGRQMEGTGKLVANHTEDAVDTQQKWDYTTAKTAWDVLCHRRDAGVFHAKWKDEGCLGFVCESLGFKCDPDDEVHTIEIYWKHVFKKTMILPKTATPVTTDDGRSFRFFRFFLESEGCPGDGKSDKDCELPWEVFDKERAPTEDGDYTPTMVDITRHFLVYDARIPNRRVVSVETNRYEAHFDKSEVETLGTGTPLPTLPVYAGAFGTGCRTGLAECSKPVSGPEPVDETTEIDVTTNFLVELKSAPGNVSIMTNRNWARTTKTKAKEFVWGN